MLWVVKIIIIEIKTVIGLDKTDFTLIYESIKISTLRKV